MILLALTAARMFFNYINSNTNGVAEVRFDSVRLSRSGTVCIISNSNYWAKGLSLCRLKTGYSYVISGNRKSQVIDKVLGRIWLDEPVITRELGVSPDWISHWRDVLVSKTEKYLSEPEASLVLGIVLGYKGSLTTDFYQALVYSGTIHMVVASGYNVMIVALLIMSVMLNFFRRRTATVITMVMVAGYIALTGAEVSILRAGLMGGLILMGTMLGRSNKSGWSLVLAVWLMFVVEPTVVLSISFQLSVAATFGVIILSPHLSARLKESKMRLFGLMERLELMTTVSAILITWPIIWFHFGRGSWIAIVSNSVILPLVPILMCLGAILIVTAMFFPVVAPVISWPVYGVAHLVVVLVEWFGKL